MSPSEVLQEKISNSQTNNSQDLNSVSNEVKCKNSFGHFFFGVFCNAVRRVEGNYCEPSHLDNLIYRLQKYRRTSTKAPRFHLKSTVTEAFIMWKLYRMEKMYNEWMYMSFTEGLGAYHTKRIKRYINALPELFSDYLSLTESESVIAYQKDNRAFVCEPAGILTLQRGKHPNGMILDDVLKDPQVKLDMSQIEKISTLFFEEIEQMPKEDLHIVGTPQAEGDLFSQLETKQGYDCASYDVYTDEKNKKVLWEAKYNWQWLEERKNLIGDKAFMKEFRLQPVHGSEGFISLKEYSNISCVKLKNYDILKLRRFKDRNCVAGMDLGKKTHPSHLSIFFESKGSLIQVHSKFMDGWNYNDQIDYCKRAIEFFKIDTLYFDNTRAEFETSAENNTLPKQMKGITFTSKSKFSMSTELDRLITSKKLLLIEEPRQRRQILSVDCDLNAPETAEGHGDAFFSLCLAVKAWADMNKTGGEFVVPDWDVSGRSGHY